jgi:CBS domain-containing protein
MAVAADIMTREVMTVSPDTPVRDVADLLANNRFGSLPVVDQYGHVQGIVAEEDMVMRAADVHLPRHLTFLGSIIFLENPDRFTEEAEKILALTAAELMEKEFATARPDEPVDKLAARMLDGDLRRVLVLDDSSRLQGIITRADIVRMQLRGEQLPDAGEQ